MSCIDHVEAGGARAPRVLRQQNRLRQECTVGTGRSMQESTLAEYRKQQQQIQSGFQILDFGCACGWISNVVLISDGGQGDQVPRTMRCDALLLRRTRAFRDSPTKSSLGGQVGRERKVYRRCALERPFKPQVVRWQSAVATDFQTSSPADLKNPTACPDIAALDSICIAMYGQSGSKGKGWAPETACREHRRCQVLEGKGDRFGGACRGQRGSCNGTTVCGRQAMVEVQQIETIATGGQHSETETQLVRARGPSGSEERGPPDRLPDRIERPGDRRGVVAGFGDPSISYFREESAESLQTTVVEGTPGQERALQTRCVADRCLRCLQGPSRCSSRSSCRPWGRRGRRGRRGGRSTSTRCGPRSDMDKLLKVLTWVSSVGVGSGSCPACLVQSRHIWVLASFLRRSTMHASMLALEDSVLSATLPLES